MIECPACSKPVSANSRFCRHCGAALPAESERRHSTVLVDSDLVVEDDSSDLIDHGSFLPGTIIAERYRIVGLLGKGGMGEVYRADDLKLGQTVALKFLAADFADDPVRRERFHNEVRIARQVAHPNVCRVYDIGEVDGLTYLSMEYVDGEDLSSLVRRIGRVPSAKAIEIARQICAGIAAIHEQGILHRDLKPANVMLDGRGKVRITDFGLAALAEELTGAAARAGTPAYMAPEQLTGGEFTVRGDVYTLGLTLYELFTGRRAFLAESIDEYRHLHAKVPPADPSSIIAHVDPAIEQLILQCLEKDRERRPSSALAVAARLPGGDPLAAALAAGETPSPELVAATAPAEGVPPSVSVACLLLILLGIFAFPFLNDHVKLHGFVPLNKSPAVLIDRAQQIIRELGYGQQPTDYAAGFELDEAYLDHIESRDDSPTRWAQLAAGRPAAMRFWYRQSPRQLVPDNMLGTVTPSDPPPLVPEMISVALDDRGRLLSFRVTPAARELPTATHGAPDWSALLDAGHLDPRRFQPAASVHVPPLYCDHRAAWAGTFAENPNVRMRVEAGAYLGKPVYFEIMVDRDAGPAEDENEGLTVLQAGRLVNVLLVLGCLAGAGVLARRNLAQGRGDRRGAFRVSLLVGGAMMIAWALQANHVPDAVVELRLLSVAAGRSLVSAAMCWLLYIALEPYVRQRWPDMLISWNRLLASRWRDPVVGRDLLIGALFGIVGSVLRAVLYFGPVWLGAPAPRPAAVANAALMGFKEDLAQLLRILTVAVLEPMALLLVLLLLLVLVRKRRAAVPALFVLVTGLMTLITFQPGGNLLINAAMYAMLSAALLFVLLRFGLLAVMIAMFYVLLLDTFPITADTQAWYIGASHLALTVAGAGALLGFSTSLAGRRVLRNAVPGD